VNSASPSSRSDDELLRIAKSVLEEQGFHVETVSEDIDLVLAEDNYFVVAVAATNTIRDLILAEPVAFGALAQRIESAALGPKKWDTYLVLLTQEKSPEDDSVTRDLYAINYDTSRLRRIAHTGVDPTPDAVSHALAPFVQPATSATSAAQADAFDSLLRALVSRGVDEELAQRAITAFEQGATLDDVL
jgi:glutamine synthetase type III